MAGETDLDVALAAADCAVVAPNHLCCEWAAIWLQAVALMDMARNGGGH